ncbi:MAG TPA: RHS repeat domain-containing protein [Acidimicrobiales bacterium]|nr:RHS repeat domain-containing protein [Acidimicrobiales bacterium]
MTTGADPTTPTADAHAFRRRYEHDARGRLVAVVDDAGWRIDLEYDASGNRVRRVVSIGRAATRTSPQG